MNLNSISSKPNFQLTHSPRLRGPRTNHAPKAFGTKLGVLNTLMGNVKIPEGEGAPSPRGLEMRGFPPGPKRAQ